MASSRSSTDPWEGANEMLSEFASQRRPPVATDEVAAEGSASASASSAPPAATQSLPKRGSLRKTVARKTTGGIPARRLNSSQSQSTLSYIHSFQDSRFIQVTKDHPYLHQSQPLFHYSVSGAADIYVLRLTLWILFHQELPQAVEARFYLAPMRVLNHLPDANQHRQRLPLQ